MNNYYAGGLAELISRPSELTYSFLSQWLTGKESLGKAMHLLGVSAELSSHPVVVMYDGELVVDLTEEENTLYKNTLFSYKKKGNIHSQPELYMNPGKFFSPPALVGTAKLLITQSKWIAKQDDLIHLAKKLVDYIPVTVPAATWQEEEKVITHDVLPYILAVGMLAEFYNQYLEKEIKGKKFAAEVHTYIAQITKNHDWFFQSLIAQRDVKNGTLAFNRFLELFGMKADSDYELTSPRWYEIPDVIKRRIAETIFPEIPQDTTHISVPDNIKKIVATVIELQTQRLEAKRKALIHIAKLRLELLEEAKNLKVKLDQVTRESFVKGEVIKSPDTPIVTTSTTTLAPEPKQSQPNTDNDKATNLYQTTSQGKGVSQGAVAGITHQIHSSIDKIENDTIGIFPNASPEFTLQYPQCKGIIFLVGGVTSHGAIVAREFGIPALVDAVAKQIPDGSKIEIDGSTGKWEIK